jgi:predicted DNA-binding transcriptional regulator YafY
MVNFFIFHYKNKNLLYYIKKRLVMEDKPRYSRISDIIDLIIYMLSKLNGVSLMDIQHRFNVSRRTAERMRDSVLAILPQVDEIETDERCKRWGFTNYTLNELISFSKKDIAFLERLKTNCDNVSQTELEDIITKLKALTLKHTGSLDESKIESLLHVEGYAIRQTQNYKIDLKTISTIRQAIKECRKIKVIYHEKNRILEPLGLIYGEKVHLIAREKLKGVGEFNYILNKIKNIELTNEKFDPNGFDLQEFSKQSFGVYFGEIYNVKLKFIPESREDVLNYNFHPTQKIKLQDDGSVIVTFKASGDKHIMWNLFKWGYAVEIISPKSLKVKYRDYIDSIRKKF